jgi:GTP-binding protein HflX
MDEWGNRLLPALNNSTEYAAEVSVSALRNRGMDDLLDAIERALMSVLKRVKLLLPYQQGELVSLLHESATVESQEHTGDGVILTVQLPVALYERFKDYRV